MRLRNLAIISLTGLLFFPKPAEATTEVQLMDDGTQLQIHFTEKALDLNHDQDQRKRHEFLSGIEQARGSKTEAGGMNFQAPLRRGLSNTNQGIY